MPQNGIFTEFLASGFIQAASTDVSNPLYDVMIRIVQLGLEHFEVPYFQARGSEGDLNFAALLDIVISFQEKVLYSVSFPRLASKFMLTGGRFHFFFSTEPVDNRSISAEIWDSFIPPILLILKFEFLKKLRIFISTSKQSRSLRPYT